MFYRVIPNFYFCFKIRSINYGLSFQVQPNLSKLLMLRGDELVVNEHSLVGSGAFGSVYRGEWRPSTKEQRELLQSLLQPSQSSDGSSILENGTCSGSSTETDRLLSSSNPGAVDVAIKVLHTGATELGEFLEEARMMASVRHKNCVPLLGVCVGGMLPPLQGARCLVSPYVPLGSLDKYLEKHRREISGETLLNWCRQIADGMSHLEGLGVIHRDLASRNVLVESVDRVQLTDFGLARMLSSPKEDSEMEIRSGRVPIRWLAIETLRFAKYSPKTDVWAYGVTLWEIFTFGKRPYADIATESISQHVLAGGRLSQPDVCTIELYQVMLSCWDEDPKRRPSFQMLFEIFSRFFKNPYQYVHRKSVSSSTPSDLSRNSLQHSAMALTNPLYLDGPGPGSYVLPIL
ncbi:Receptor tyrosine-protein kinase erbB-2 [Cichlidogyrus casuarinus]|uniref:Receptor tyrosine-protein kinase erbB-2 n=1 Tax=Cichlidogyrus casuarinus TaxID=1844966 RepID=A0ABD2QGW1_9PLAT